jgi:3-oxoacyl-(acyl-carrier-protein) synthase/acyl carrier protein/SAM-dependent methyltransferase
MRPDPATIELGKQTTGILPMETAAGIAAFYRSLALPSDRILVVEGLQPAIEVHLQRERILTAAPYRYANKAEELYSDTTSMTSAEFKEEYLTFAPFEQRRPGFSMSRVLLHRDQYPEEAAYALSRQIEMRQVLFCEEDFTKLTSVLDFGCGHGTDVIQIGALFPHLQVHGCTITRDQAMLGNGRIAGRQLDNQRVKIYHKDSSKGPFPSRYDLIFGIEVSFHIRDKAGLFGNICGALDDDGRVLLMDYVSNLPGSMDDPNVEISIPTGVEWARLTAQFHLEIAEVIDVSPQIANFLYDPELQDNLSGLADVTQRTLRNYANQSRSLDRGWISYVLLKLTRNDRWDQARLESHNLAKLQEPTPYPVALQTMLRKPHVQYPPRTTSAGHAPAGDVPAPVPPQRHALDSSAAPRPIRPHFETLLSRDDLERRIKNSLAAVLRVEAPLIDVDQPFSELGLDSFLGTELIIAINGEYGLALSNVEVFNYPTVRELAQFLEGELGRLPIEAKPARAPLAPNVPAPPVGGPHLTLKRKAGRVRTAPAHSQASDDRIAIVGMSGRYPQANDLSEYWDNLAHGKNSVTEVPPERWDVHRHYDGSPATKDSKWLGAIGDIDCFDPLFFRISPQEAAYIDPQHRLFLQEAYRAFEDAGYSSSALGDMKCGVYLGIGTSEYAHLLSIRNALANASVTSNSSSIAAARIAYYLNLKGPAIAIDTACSSSLVAIHLACQALARRETDMALAGGVTLWLTPESFRSMSQAGMLAADGQCKAFDDSADGVVVGDGVGALVLKRLKDAQKDNDFIYGVILGSGINQDGRTNGITAPSVNSQIELERGVYAKYGIDPATITYVEAHGTGTKLGDPIELEALAAVFREKTDRKNFCALGSVKSNIGHTTCAAGVAGVQKVLLSMQHQTLVPTLHVKKENAHFDFKNSPFYVSQKTEPWNVEPGSLRRSAVSSFGYSGTNAHLVIEEYRMPAENTVPAGGRTPVIVPLSAKTTQVLRQRAQDLLAFIRTAPRPIDVLSMAYTLQTGREPMEERLAFEVTSVDQLAEKLAAYLAGDKRIEGAHQGRAEASGEGMAIIDRDDDMREAIDRWIARGKLSKLLELWVRGASFDWKKLYSGRTPQRISLPAYPFARERCWIDASPSSQAPGSPSGADLKSIEDIIDQIDDDLIDTDDAVTALKMLV